MAIDNWILGIFHYITVIGDIVALALNFHPLAELLGAVCSKVEGIPIVVIRKLIGDKCSILTDAVLLAVLFYNASLCISANAFCVKVIIGITDRNCGLVSNQRTVFVQIQVIKPDASLRSLVYKCIILPDH